MMYGATGFRRQERGATGTPRITRGALVRGASGASVAMRRARAHRRGRPTARALGGVSA
jgi:hypothetical protein